MRFNYIVNVFLCLVLANNTITYYEKIARDWPSTEKELSILKKISFLLINFQSRIFMRLREALTNLLDCDVVVSEFELQSHFFWSISNQEFSFGRWLREALTNLLDCDFVTSEFELQSRYYFYFWTNIFGKDISLGKIYLWERYETSLSPPLFYNDGFGNQQTTKADVPLSRETKTNLMNE